MIPSLSPVERVTSPVSGGHAAMVYLPDHEPALGSSHFPHDPEWTSGYALAEGADLLVHDSQYTPQEYLARVGYGHSSVPDALRFAGLAGVKKLVPFHHDPAHSDDFLDLLINQAIDDIQPDFLVVPGREGQTFEWS